MSQCDKKLIARTILRLTLLLCCGGFVFAEGPPGIWLDVPFVKQVKDGCGSASIAMVMQYWLHQQERPMTGSAEAEQIQRSLYSHKAHGIYAQDLQNYLGQQEFRAYVFHGDWGDLKHHLEKGRPLIVALKPVAENDLHYEVVAGLDWSEHVVLVNDPAQRKLLKQDWSSFQREWSATGNWVLLAVPQAGAP